MSEIAITLGDNIERQAAEILDCIGMSLSDYFNLAARQLCITRRVSFDIVAPAPEPNEETRRALVTAEAEELDLIPDDTPGFTDADELISFLDSQRE